MSMGGHQSSRMGTDEWLTPPEILKELGPFDLDPCASIVRPWPTAYMHYTKQDDGLSKQWGGRVWCNPPYGNKAAPWLRRCAEHGNAIALIFARTETVSFFDSVWDKADAVLFIRGRLTFYRVDGRPAKGNGGAPSALVAYGIQNMLSLKFSGISGKFIQLK